MNFDSKILTWKCGSFEFEPPNMLDEIDVALTDVFYIIRLCCYENEQSEKLKIEICNNKTFAKS